MTKIYFTAEIVGGPHDGKVATYDGTGEDDVLEKMDKVEMFGHIYKIIEFDKNKMRAVVMW